ncbi:MAG: carboxymuconolactone decarboxylase family protein [Gemmatimonadota bacterium]|nr:carboxymuconolactone decarboxylase family protein [Gemmatimonadota bacterium]
MSPGRARIVNAIADGLGVEALSLVRLSAKLGGGREDWAACLREARAGATDVAIEEIILQSYLFVGFPRVLNVLGTWRQIVEPPTASADPGLESRRKGGEALCRRIYGPAYERLRAHVAALNPDLDRWMIEEGYGKTLSRPSLGPILRELCVVALLATAGHEPQLRSHLRGALNVGAAAAHVAEALEIGLAEADRPAVARPDPVVLREAWAEVRVKARVD